jgi:hypothetical protein
MPDLGKMPQTPIPYEIVRDTSGRQLFHDLPTEKGPRSWANDESFASNRYGDRPMLTALLGNTRSARHPFELRSPGVWGALAALKLWIPDALTRAGGGVDEVIKDHGVTLSSLLPNKWGEGWGANATREWAANRKVMTESGNQRVDAWLKNMAGTERGSARDVLSNLVSPVADIAAPFFSRYEKAPPR